MAKWWAVVGSYLAANVLLNWASFHGVTPVFDTQITFSLFGPPLLLAALCYICVVNSLRWYYWLLSFVAAAAFCVANLWLLIVLASNV